MTTFQDLLNSRSYDEFSVRNKDFINESIDQEYIANGYFDKLSFKNTSFHDTGFENCKFYECSFENCTFIIPLEDVDCDLDLLFLYKCNMSQCSFKNCTFVNLHWIRTDMNNIEFQNCNFSNISWKSVLLGDCDLKSCNFSNLISDNSILVHGTLYETNWKSISFIQAAFSNLKIQRSTFSELKFDSKNPSIIRNDKIFYKVKNFKEFQHAIKIFEE